MNPNDYGLTEEAVADIETAGEKLTPEPKKRGPRPTTLDAANAALKAGDAIPFIMLGSAQNPHVNDKGWALWKLYSGTDYAGLEAYVVKGTNTYAKLLRNYRAILLASCAAGVEPSGEAINDATVAWDTYVAERDAARKAARSERKAAKAPPADPGPYAEVETASLEQQAAEIEAEVSAKRKELPRAELDAKRATAKAMRKELASRLTPADKAASGAVASAIKTGKAPAAKPTPKAEDAALVARGNKAAPKAPDKPKAAPAAAPNVEVFKSLMGARGAARKALGDDAVEGVDFKIVGKGKRLSWIQLGAQGQAVEKAAASA